MADRVTRRAWMVAGAAAAGGLALPRRALAGWSAPTVLKSRVHPAVVCSANGYPHAIDKAVRMMADGADTLDAAVAGVAIVEDDPRDDSVGYGGLPNEEGIVELDASCMHGPSNNAGSVASLRNIKNPAAVARDVLWYTDHVMLVGEGALRFARARGYKETDLLTDESRKKWLDWKAKLSREDDWLEPQEKRPASRPAQAEERKTGTINFSVCNEKGEVSGCTTTSGLAFKIPGRVGDSPIIGAGCYVDGKVGAGGATGRGEAVIICCGGHTIVEAMRAGKHPTDACVMAIKRLLEMNTMPYLWKDGKPLFRVNFYALDVQGRVGSASVYPSQFGCHDQQGTRRADCAHVLEP